MSKKQSPSIPEAPSFQADPNVGWSQDILKGQVPNLLGLLWADWLGVLLEQ